MASYNAMLERAVAIELRHKVTTLYASLLPIFQETAAWTLNGFDATLPAPFDVRVQLEAYNALSLEKLKLVDWATALLTAAADDTLTAPPATGLFDGSATFDGTTTYSGG